MEKTKTLKPNLSKGKQKVMEELEKQRDIIIINSDKSGAVIKKDTEKFINESSSKLSNQNNYKLLRENPILRQNG